MNKAKATEPHAAEAVRVRDEWLARLTALVDQVEAWGRELDWATRRIEKPMEDEDIGPYSAPGLLLQKEFTRVLLEPIDRAAPGADGVVDLYLMPAYDDVATLFFIGGRWQVHFAPGALTKTKLRPLTKAVFQKVLAGLTRDAARP